MDQTILLYVKKILARVMKIELRLETIERKTHELGTACARAFEMCKVVVQELSEKQDEMTENLDEYGGKITESTFTLLTV